MDKARMQFLGGYYLNNLLYSKFGGRLLGARLKQFRSEWTSLKSRLPRNDAWLVVGNGPSLSADDLTRLSHLPAVASNKISLLFDKTDWRPTLYTVADPLLIYKLPRSNFDTYEQTLLPHSVALMAKAERRLAWRLIGEESAEELYIEQGLEVDPLVGLISGATITCPNIMLAMWAGARTIYIIGCDHFYSDEDHKDGTRKTEHKGGVNHFHPDYRKPGEVVNAAPVEWMNRGYALVRRIADKRGVKIVNISRRTALKAFDIGDAEAVML